MTAEVAFVCKYGGTGYADGKGCRWCGKKLVYCGMAVAVNRLGFVGASDFLRLYLQERSRAGLAPFE